MACVEQQRLYQLDRHKIGLNGKKRPVYEPWQFTSYFEEDGVIYSIKRGWKYVHEDACHARRSRDVKYYKKLDGRYYKQPTQYISLKDWQSGIVRCIKQNLRQISYNWYGDTVKMTCNKKDNYYDIQIFMKHQIYFFEIHVDG